MEVRLGLIRHSPAMFVQSWMPRRPSVPLSEPVTGSSGFWPSVQTFGRGACGLRRRAMTTRVRHRSSVRTLRHHQSTFPCHPPCAAHSESRESAARMAGVPVVAARPGRLSRVSHRACRVPSCATPHSAGAMRPRTCSKCDFKSLWRKQLRRDLRASSGSGDPAHRIVVAANPFGRYFRRCALGGLPYRLADPRASNVCCARHSHDRDRRSHRDRCARS